MFLDEVISIDPGNSIIAKKTIRNDEFWIRGHFPNFAVCPGVITVEMLAQAGAVCILSLPEHKGKIALFGGINRTRFKKQIFPGNVVILEVIIIKRIGDIGIGRAKALVDGEVAVLTEITFALKSVE